MKRRNILLCSILLLLVYYLYQIYNINNINNNINNNNGNDNNDIVFNDQVLYIENFLSEKDYQKILELDTDQMEEAPGSGSSETISERYERYDNIK